MIKLANQLRQPGARQARLMAETLVLAAGATLGFAAVDVVFVLGGIISAIYLADAALELIYLGAVLGGWLVSRRSA